MAEIKSFPNNQDVYVGAEWVMKWLHGRTSGVFGAENNASVSAIQDSMSVQVSDGIGWLSNNDGDGVVWWNDSEKSNGSKLVLNLDTADGVLGRIDRVVVTWKTTNYVALPTISILKGAASSAPVAPSLTNNNIQRQISLARISIPAGTISLSNSLITDERLDQSVCGIVTERVAVDTSMVNSQVSELIEKLKEELANVEAGTAYVLKTGDTMTGPLAMSGNRVTELADPVEDSDAVPKSYAVAMKTTTVSLLHTDWSDNAQTVSAEYVTEDLEKTTVITTASSESLSTYLDCGIQCSAQGNGTLTFICESVPTEDIAVNVLILKQGGWVL